jgi:thioredoxin-like negative regulator of GroEL
MASSDNSGETNGLKSHGILETIDNLDQLNQTINQQKGVVLYFSSEACSVCKVLKPKVKELMVETYPRMHLYYIDTQNNPLIAGQHRVFTIPTLLIFFQGREHARLSRNIGLHQLDEAIARPYEMVFEG